jgi:hypothetical protein
MAQSLPTIRPIYAPALVPQLVAIAAIAAAIHIVTSNVSWLRAAVIAALTYWILCRMARVIVLGHHAAAIAAYKARKFDEALTHNKASFDFFDAHPMLDRYRALVLGVTSPNTFRTIALTNTAYCHAMRGDRTEAAAIFTRVLKETPDCANAEFGLKMLEGTSTNVS